MNFVTKLQMSPGIHNGFNTVVFPVIPEGAFDLSHAKTAKYHTLGGNHLRTTLQSLHAEGKLSAQKQNVHVIIYK